MKDKTKIALISHPDCMRHEMGKLHPEQPARLQVIEDEISKAGLDTKLKKFLAPLATHEQISRAHDMDYIKYIFEIAPKSGLVSLDPDTWMNQYTLKAALRAAGATVKAVDLIMSNQVTVAFCNIRPPGHHAERRKAMGFCFFNNVAIGVAHALEYYQLKRIAIIDFDVHHGNGTEDIFKNENRVLLCSSFQHPFYPGSGAQTKSDHILNLPLPKGTNGKLFREEIQKSWFDTIIKFNPEMIFFSAGFDGHRLDPLSGFMLTEDDFAWLTKKIKDIATKTCHGRIVSVLEGGYALEVLGRCVTAHLNALIYSI